MSAAKNILLAFYGDDFTGSTDALEFLCRAGAKTVLFIDPPNAAQLSRYPDLDAFGVAGMTRSMPPAKMEETLLPAFEKLKQSGARHVHYKVCSTFDSSAHTGSIGKAIETGMAVFNSEFIPLLVAAPVLGRYCLFGNLFARMGTAGEGAIYRLDRHPSMSRHPVTPANESDLRLHLSVQTNLGIGLLDIIDLSASKGVIYKRIEGLLKQKYPVVLIDALYEEQLVLIGELLDNFAKTGTLFSTGSSGIEMALGQYWNATQTLSPVNNWVQPGKAAPMLVVSGSCSPITTAQVVHAKSIGFAECILDMADVIRSNNLSSVIETAADTMKAGKSVIVHSDGINKKETVPAEKTGTALGTIAGEVAKRVAYDRLVIAGGDTSSYAARTVGIESVEMIAPIVPGAPLCRAKAPGSPIDGMEVNFKGGQVGDKNYFETVLNG